VHSMTCNVWILMCRDDVGSILMMFDVLDCYILYMCLLLFIYYILYTCLVGSPIKETDKIGKQIKKSLCSSVPDEHVAFRRSYVYPVTFLSYVRRLYSSVINIYLSVFSRRTFLCFL
jgi:hypothetical protein